MDECIGAYLTALALNPENGDLRLNLAQLLFIKGNDVEANKQLQEAIKLPLTESAQLEAQFYLLAYVASDAAEILRENESSPVSRLRQISLSRLSIARIPGL